MLGIVLLTWLLLRGIGNDGMRYEQALQAFNEFAFAEASLHRDVLQARAGLLLDYDAFSASAAAMKNAVTQLRSLAQTEGLDSGRSRSFGFERRQAGGTRPSSSRAATHSCRTRCPMSAC